MQTDEQRRRADKLDAKTSHELILHYVIKKSSKSNIFVEINRIIIIFDILGTKIPYHFNEKYFLYK